MNNEMLAEMFMTLQQTISELGFLPDECGDTVKNILKRKDTFSLMMLGRYLEDCGR